MPEDIQTTRNVPSAASKPAPCRCGFVRATVAVGLAFAFGSEACAVPLDAEFHPVVGTTLTTSAQARSGPLQLAHLDATDAGPPAPARRDTPLGGSIASLVVGTVLVAAG